MKRGDGSTVSLIFSKGKLNWTKLGERKNRPYVSIICENTHNISWYNMLEYRCEIQYMLQEEDK